MQFDPEAAAAKNMSMKVIGGAEADADLEDSQANASTIHTSRPSLAERKYSSYGVEIRGEV